MLWEKGQDLDLLNFYRELIFFRQQNFKIWQQERECIMADDTTGVYGYCVGDAIAFLNNSPQARSVTLQKIEHYQLKIGTNREIKLNNADSEIYLPAYAGALFLRK
jgi:hypothetical protein